MLMKLRISDQSGDATFHLLYSLEMVPEKESVSEQFKRFSSEPASPGGKFFQIWIFKKRNLKALNVINQSSTVYLSFKKLFLVALQTLING